MTDPVKEAREHMAALGDREGDMYYSTALLRNFLAYIDRLEKEPVVRLVLSEEDGEDDYFFYEVEPLNKRIEPGLFRRLPEEGE